MINAVDLTKYCVYISWSTANTALKSFKSIEWGPYTVHSASVATLFYRHSVNMEGIQSWEVYPKLKFQVDRVFSVVLLVIDEELQLHHERSINDALPCVLSPVHHVLDLVFVCDKIDAHQSSVTVGGVESLETIAKVALYSQTCQATAQVLHTYKFYNLVQASLIFLYTRLNNTISI